MKFLTLKTCVSTGCVQSKIHKPDRYAYDGHHQLDILFMMAGKETILQVYLKI